MAIQVVKIREFTGHSQAVYAIAPAGQASFYSGGGDGMLVRWDLSEPDGLLLARHESAIYSILPGPGFIYTGTQKGVISAIDITATQGPRQVNPGCGPVFDLVFYEGNMLAATGSGALLVMDPETFSYKAISLSAKSLRKITLVKGLPVVTGSDGVIRFLDRDCRIIHTIDAHELSVFALAWHQEDDILLSGGRNAVVKVFKEQVGIETINAHLLHIHDIAFNPPQTMFLTCSMDKHIKLWDARERRLLKVIEHEKHGGHTSSVNKILWFDKNNFISCSDDRTLKCFEILEK